MSTQDALVELINQRVSFPRLGEPAPGDEVLQDMFKSAFRAPDHMMLRPWRYLLVQGDARQRLGETFCRLAVDEDPELSEVQREKLLNMPLRAPLIVVGISQNIDHPKVPVREQEISCGVGLGYMLLTLQARGFGGIWRTGPLAEHEGVKDALGVRSTETIVGFLYVGTPLGDAKPIPALEMRDFVQDWQGPVS